MKHAYLDNIEIENALDKFTLQQGHVLSSEEIPVTKALGRITSQAVYAKISSPHYNACAMDGIALLASSTFNATETNPVILIEGTDFLRVDTGDPLPTEYDSVVMIEDCIDVGEGKIKLLSAATPWQHIRQIGEDICANEMILPSYSKLAPASLGALLAGGILKVQVLVKPVVGIIPTGDEIVNPTDNPKEGEIIEFNSLIFSSMLENWGAVPKIYDIVKDDLEKIKTAVTNAANECDLVIINAGSSAGREDYTSKAVAETGELLIHGIAIKPGKPTILGLVNGRPAIGIPGYPVSGILVMEKLVRPILENMYFTNFGEPLYENAILTRTLVSSLKYKEFVRVRLGMVDDRLVATPLNRGAGVVTSFVKADGLLEIPLNSEGFEAGKEYRVQLLRRKQDINNTLVINGSHDSLLDVAADIYARRNKGYSIASSHVGSMGGIIAVKRRECHLSGIHLLDEETGEYNTTYIEKYLSTQPVALIKCVNRVQGIITAKGNPKGIKSLEDLRGNRFVNRQKGSGTRILLDYLMKQSGITANEINGYEREEFTHLSVAALVASNSADAGLGVYSAAFIYGLDFVPICEEEYDFVLPKQYLELDLVKKFIDVIESQEFKNELEKIGGYKMR